MKIKAKKVVLSYNNRPKEATLGKDNSHMKQVIMHKDTEVCHITLDDRGYVESVDSVESEELLPCVPEKNIKDLKFGIQKWLLTRMISRGRSDYAPLRTFYGEERFVSKNRVSLADCYWAKEEDGKETWSEVNPFKNWDEDSDSYFGILNEPEDTYMVDNVSPNLTIPGVEHRFWYRLGSQVGYLNEAAQSDMAFYKKALEIGCGDIVAKRQYLILSGKIYTFTPSETSESVERVPFDVLYDACEEQGLSKMENLKKTCDTYGISKWKSFFSLMTKMDNATGNNERELCDIGVLRNSDTLEVIGFSKI